MKILLDIDGVMIPARPWQTYQMGADGFGVFSRFSVEGLNNIIESSTNPEIVLITSHKHSYSISQWRSIFSNRGITKTKISRLDSDSLEISRIKEINDWYLLNQHEPFIIIDDDKGLNDLELNIKEDHLISTSPTIGLNRVKTEEAIDKVERLQEMIHD